MMMAAEETREPVECRREGFVKASVISGVAGAA
jgi:hypothetical protein